MAKKNIYFKFEMLILCILKNHDCYGYDLTTSIKELSDGLISIKEGTLYPTLYKLLDAGYISSVDKLVNRKLRVYYHLENSGEEYLETLKNDYLLWDEKIRKILAKGDE